MLFIPSDCEQNVKLPFLTIEIIQTQIVKHGRSIDDLLNLTCFQVNLQNQSTLSSYYHTKAAK